jgi:predicted nucleic acid-binding protein
MISNSSPLIFLAKIDGISLLDKLFRSLTIPFAVKEEVLIENKSGFMLINGLVSEGKIKIVDPEKVLDIRLGKGENAAISLAKEKGDGLIIDDALGVRAARALGVEVMRTTSVILLGVKKKLLKKKEGMRMIDKLIEEGYYISSKYYARIFEKLRL